MSYRIESNGYMDIHGGTLPMEDVHVYATDIASALRVDTSRFMMGSLLYVIREAETYMLDDDGPHGVWVSMKTGKRLQEEV